MRESNHKEFGAVRDRLNSIFAIVSRQTPVRHVMQEFPSISIEPRARNIQFPPTMIDVGSEVVNQLLRVIHSITLDLNKFLAQVPVELQHVAARELVDR